MSQLVSHHQSHQKVSTDRLLHHRPTCRRSLRPKGHHHHHHHHHHRLSWNHLADHHCFGLHPIHLELLQNLQQTNMASVLCLCSIAMLSQGQGLIMAATLSLRNADDLGSRLNFLVQHYHATLGLQGLLYLQCITK